MSLLASVFVVWPWWRHRGQQVAQTVEVMDRQQANIALYRQHLAELETVLDSGSRDEAQWAQLKHELERSLLADSEGASEEGASEEGASEEGASVTGTVSSGRVWLLILAVVLPLSAGVIYWQLGARQ